MTEDDPRRDESRIDDRSVEKPTGDRSYEKPTGDRSDGNSTGDRSAEETETTVGVRVHFTMTGTTPLRLADLFFTDDGLTIVEYGRITPLVGLAIGSPEQRAAEMARTYAEGGLSAVADAGERTIDLAYDEVDRVVLHDGGRLARERIAIRVREGPPYAYRIHAPIDLEPLESGLARFPPTANLAVERRRGSGFSPIESLRRFRRGR